MGYELIKDFLFPFGINVASNVAYDVGKLLILRLKPGEKVNAVELQKEIASLLHIQNAEVIAKDLICFLANRGDLSIQGTYIFSDKAITMSSAAGTKLVFGNGSISDNRKSQIKAGLGATITASGGASVEQREDGSIIFKA